MELDPPSASSSCVKLAFNALPDNDLLSWKYFTRCLNWSSVNWDIGVSINVRRASSVENDWPDGCGTNWAISAEVEGDSAVDESSDELVAVGVIGDSIRFTLFDEFTQKDIDDVRYNADTGFDEFDEQEVGGTKRYVSALDEFSGF